MSLTLRQYFDLIYDQNGNLIERSDNSSSNEWDYNNRLIQIIIRTRQMMMGPMGGGQGWVLTYIYDPQGTRVSGTYDDGLNPAATTTYPTAYFNTDGNKKTEHIFANGVPVGTVETTGINSPVIFWNSQDHLRSTSVVTDANAQIAESVEYYAFGSIKSNTGAHKEQRKYTGHEFDILSKYTYAQARYLDTKVGRFLSEDSVFLAIGDRGFGSKTRGSAFDTGYSNIDDREALEALLKNPQALNSYGYVLNNPLKFVDREGEVAQLIAAIGARILIGAGIGAGTAGLFTIGSNYLNNRPLTENLGKNVLVGAVAGAIVAPAGLVAGSLIGASPVVLSTATKVGIQLGTGVAFSTAGQLAGSAITGSLPSIQNIGTTGAGSIAGGGTEYAYNATLRALPGVSPPRGFSSLQQATYFAPRSFSGYFGSQNALLTLLQITLSALASQLTQYLLTHQ